jgi:uncharacterized RDD family membrane protein YckC
MSTNNFLFNFNVKTENDEPKNYATITKKSLAGFIDFFIVLFLRACFLQILNDFYLSKLFYNFLNDFENKFGTREPKGTHEHVSFVLHHPIFIYSLIIIIFVLLIGAIYYSYFNSSSWQATIGKRIAKIIVVNKNSEKISFSTALYHYLLNLIPIIFLILVLIYSQKNKYNIYATFSKNQFLTICGFLVLVASNCSFLNKKKLNFFDYLLKIEFHQGKTQSKMPWTKNL